MSDTESDDETEAVEKRRAMHYHGRLIALKIELLIPLIVSGVMLLME